MIVMENDEVNLFLNNWIKTWNLCSPDKLIKFYSKNATYRDPYVSGGIKGDQLLNYFEKLMHSYGNWNWSILEIFPIKDGAFLKWNLEIIINNHLISETGVDLIEFQDKKIINNEVYFDRSGWLKAVSLKDGMF